MRVPEQRTARCIYDFEMCRSVDDLKKTIGEINQNGWELVCVAPGYERFYFVFFRRAAV